MEPFVTCGGCAALCERDEGAARDGRVFCRDCSEGMRSGSVETSRRIGSDKIIVRRVDAAGVRIWLLRITPEVRGQPLTLLRSRCLPRAPSDPIAPVSTPRKGSAVLHRG